MLHVAMQLCHLYAYLLFVMYLCPYVCGNSHIKGKQVLVRDFEKKPKLKMYEKPVLWEWLDIFVIPVMG